MSQANLLAPRRISLVKVGGALILVLGLIGGTWYVYTQQQRLPVAPEKTSPMPATREPVKPAKLTYEPSPNGTEPSYYEQLLAKVQELEAQLATSYQRTVQPTMPASPPVSGPRPAPVITPANPQVTQEAKAKRKAIAESRRTPLVVIHTGAKDTAGLDRRTLPRGWKIPFGLETRVHSDIPGNFLGRVSEVVYSSGSVKEPLIPQGATLLGNALSGSLVAGNERLPMSGVTLSIPDRKPIDLGAMPVLDAAGQTGMVDELDRHVFRMIGGIFVGGFIRGSTRVIQQEAAQMEGAGAMASGMAQSIDQGTARQVQTLYDVRPTIIVYQGNRGYVLVTKPLTIPGR